jgi:hypothetical protein
LLAELVLKLDFELALVKLESVELESELNVELESELSVELESEEFVDIELKVDSELVDFDELLAELVLKLDLLLLLDAELFVELESELYVELESEEYELELELVE